MKAGLVNSLDLQPRRRAVRYSLAFVAVAAGFGLRVALTAWIGPGLPTYITFYPAVMVAALVAGFGPGLLAAALTGLLVAYWILPPEGQFVIASPVDRVGLVLFGGMGVFMSTVAEFYRRDRRKAAAYDRETAVRETRREKEFLADILEHASQPFAVGYPDGRLGLCNRAYEELTGYSAEELRAIDWATTLTPPEWRELEKQRLEELHRRGQPVRYEKEYVRKDGTRVPIELLVQVVRDAEGKPEYYYSFLTDITERKRGESVLQATLQRLYVVLSSMNSAVLLVSNEGRVEFANPAFCSYFGLANAPTDVAGLDSRTMVEKIKNAYLHPDEAAARIQEVVDRGQPVKSEELAMQGGRTVLRSFVPLNVQGKPYGRLWIHFDITERKRAEEALKTAHDELEVRVEERTAELYAASRYARSLLEASLDPLVTISAEGKITDVNDASVQATGVPREWLIGTDFSNYFTEPDKAREGYQRVFAEGFVRDYPLAIRHSSGRTTDVLYNATVYRNKDGAVEGVFAAARDVTERKRAEAELARYREHLENLVKLRTAELARSNQELEQFAYVASHDLQEPLRAVAGYLGLIESRLGDRLDDKGRHHIEGAVQGAARMHALITDLLTLSRVDTRGKAFEPTDLKTALDMALTSLQVSLKESGANIICDPLPTLRADAGQMAQLFQNLIGNAIKFRGDRPLEIRISAKRQADDAWLMAVRDNGIGIEPQYFERIFLIFQRLHSRNEYPGTGMGLAICKKIVERHGGRIWVESQPGQGSIFYFTIPNKGTS